MDPGLNQLLKWSIENSGTPEDTSSTNNPPNTTNPSNRLLNADALRSLMGGPSDADLMKESMAAIQSPDISLPNKLIAFDNFEQLIESIDNANNLGPLGLWTPLIQLLESPEPDLRRMAAWCVGTAVQNNVRAQERLLVLGGIPILIHLATNDPNEPVRRKAIYALSSEIRNYQPATTAALEDLPEAFRPGGEFDAGDMDAIDNIIEALRQNSIGKEVDG